MNNETTTLAGERTQKSNPDQGCESAEHSTEGYRPERVRYLLDQTLGQFNALSRNNEEVRESYRLAINELQEQDKRLVRQGVLLKDLRNILQTGINRSHSPSDPKTTVLLELPLMEDEYERLKEITAGENPNGTDG